MITTDEIIYREEKGNPQDPAFNLTPDEVDANFRLLDERTQNGTVHKDFYFAKSQLVNGVLTLPDIAVSVFEVRFDDYDLDPKNSQASSIADSDYSITYPSNTITFDAATVAAMSGTGRGYVGYYTNVALTAPPTPIFPPRIETFTANPFVISRPVFGEALVFRSSLPQVPDTHYSTSLVTGKWTQINHYDDLASGEFSMVWYLPASEEIYAGTDPAPSAPGLVVNDTSNDGVITPVSGFANPSDYEFQLV